MPLIIAAAFGSAMGPRVAVQPSPGGHLDHGQNPVAAVAMCAAVVCVSVVGVSSSLDRRVPSTAHRQAQGRQ